MHSRSAKGVAAAGIDHQIDLGTQRFSGRAHDFLIERMTHSPKGPQPILTAR